MKRLGKILRRVISKRASTNRKANLPVSRISNESRFALSELSNLTRLVPSLTEIFNQAVKSSKLYPETKNVVMTGNFKTDRTACKIAYEMHDIKDEIASAVRAANKAHSNAARTSCLKEAERLENKFNHLKNEFRGLILGELNKK